MEFDRSDSSGTDDDFPPSHRNKFKQADHATGNGRLAAVGSGPFPRVQNDMETQIHNIEQEAYTSVLRAFKAQSDAITWEKESLITELRKELRVSDEEHRELLSRVNADDIIREIREWRKTSGLQPGAVNTSQPVHDHIPSPTVSAPHKKQKTSQSVASLSLGAPSPIVQPSSSTARQGPPSGGKTKKPKSSLQLPSTGLASRSQVTNRGGCSGAFATNQPPEATSYDPMIGRKVWTRWPDDNHFYEAVITDYNASEISPKDIRWEGEDPGISQRGVRAGPGRGIKKSVSRGGAVTVVGRGRGMTKVLKKNFISSQTNGSRRKPTSDIELLHTDTLIKEVEKIFSANHPDPVDMEKAKKMLKEHEQALVNAIARLGDASDGESDGEPPFSQVQSTDREIGWKKRKHDHLGGVSVGKLPTDGSASSAHPREDRHYR
ncbi:protein EMSY-LIKE 3 isoform X4 [Arachis duranensis]|uniref:Protein EMSY-LIKE 3 isoform X4 n=1 Tax=Arachis duranensis TaxID=130453 RepID=A0A9C6TJR7_ARADU|nr:protein EMSY-LIKE 3 isoform X4 [Arachis duranensis]